jgi:mono/diheme cytochrome c family protein
MVGVLAFCFGAAAADDPSVKYKDAASYYKEAKCVVCHGKKAEKKFDTTKTDDDMLQIILKGKKVEKPPHMPGYEAKGITADQAKELIAYMKSLKV